MTPDGPVIKLQLSLLMITEDISSYFCFCQQVALPIVSHMELSLDPVVTSNTAQ